MAASRRPASGSDRVAIVDPGSVVLPYDYHLVEALQALGYEVGFYGSNTRYNAEFLEAMRGLPGVQVHAWDISSTVASPWRAMRGYAAMYRRLFRDRRQYRTINLQFLVHGGVESYLYGLLRRRLVFTVHNPVPHGHAGLRHAPVARLARWARGLCFPSAYSAQDFFARYGDAFRAKSRVVQHGPLGVVPGQPPVPYEAPERIEGLAYWGTVKPYKGVELMGEFAREQATGGPEALPIEIHGLWDRRMHPLRDGLGALGVRVDDRYLDARALLALFERDLVYVLPYRSASQSGALYTLLHQGRLFIAADVGDLGAFMRRYGLEGLLLKRRDPAALRECLDYLRAHLEQVTTAFARAQREMTWTGALRAAGWGGPGSREEGALA